MSLKEHLNAQRFCFELLCHKNEHNSHNLNYYDRRTDFLESGFNPKYVDWNTFDEFEYPNREGYVCAKDVDARIDDLMKNKKC